MPLILLTLAIAATSGEYLQFSIVYIYKIYRVADKALEHGKYLYLINIL